MHDPAPSFRALHKRGAPFILANAWDVGSARVLAGLGADAIATSSSAHAFTQGRPDMGNLTRDEALAHAQDLVAATPLPVSGDFENGFGEAPETCAETVRLACEAGLAGISIEDTALPADHPYAADLATDRIRAAASAARALPRDFVLVARADGVMNGQYDIEEALRRIKAFEAAGADCVYVPLPASLADLQRVIEATALPVNVLAAGPYADISRAQFAQMGAARISIGGGLARLTHRAVIDAGRAMMERGDFSALKGGASEAEVNALMAKGSA